MSKPLVERIIEKRKEFEAKPPPKKGSAAFI